MSKDYEIILEELENEIAELEAYLNSTQAFSDLWFKLNEAIDRKRQIMATYDVAHEILAV